MLEPPELGAAVADGPRLAADSAGVEWVVDAFGCRADASGSIETLQQLIDRLVRDLDLHPVAPPVWRTFDGGGVT